MCPACYDANGNFDEAQVFKFLKEYYTNIKQDKLIDAPGYKIKDYKDGKLGSVGNRHLEDTNPRFRGKLRAEAVSFV